MKNHRAMIGAWSKDVPLRFFCCEEIKDFQPIANFQIQNVEGPGTTDAKILSEPLPETKNEKWN